MKPPLHLGPVAVTTIRMYHQLMEFEWDEAKNQTNVRKHGIGFDTRPANL